MTVLARVNWKYVPEGLLLGVVLFLVVYPLEYAARFHKKVDAWYAARLKRFMERP